MHFFAAAAAEPAAFVGVYRGHVADRGDDARRLDTTPLELLDRGAYELATDPPARVIGRDAVREIQAYDIDAATPFAAWAPPPRSP